MNVGDVIRSEHDEVRRTISKLEASGQDPEGRRQMFLQMVKIVEAHFRAEEGIVFVELRKVPSLKDLTDELTAEHNALRLLATDLANLKAGDSMWRSRLAVINELAAAHFSKEETIVIPHAPELFSMATLEALGKRFEELFNREAAK